MGRTVPSFRIAEVQEFGEWRGFRKALPRRERRVFDEMLSTARLYTSASSAAVRTSRFEGMAMAIIFHHFRQLVNCIENLPNLGQGEGALDRAPTVIQSHKSAISGPSSNSSHIT